MPVFPSSVPMGSAVISRAIWCDACYFVIGTHGISWYISCDACYSVISNHGNSCYISWYLVESCYLECCVLHKLPINCRRNNEATFYNNMSHRSTDNVITAIHTKLKLCASYFIIPAVHLRHKSIHGHRELPGSSWWISPDQGIYLSIITPIATTAGALGKRGHQLPLVLQDIRRYILQLEV